jgi:hypothetical protein
MVTRRKDSPNRPCADVICGAVSRRPIVVLFFFLSSLLSFALATRRASADEDVAPESATTTYSPYELATINAAAKKLGSEIDPDPEGKIVESVEAYRLDPIEPRDPFPLGMNKAHWTTKEEITLREVLMRPGDRYRKVLADESARNLRAYAYMSVIACVALKGSTKDRVRVVMVTKDTWSLIVDVDFEVTQAGPERLMLEIEESNFLGRQIGLTGRSIIQPESISFGAEFLDNRFASRFIYAEAEGNVIVNRRSGLPEGSFGEATVERRLFSTRSRWGWTMQTKWRDEIFRRYTNAAVAEFGGGLPFLWRSRDIEQSGSLTRSFGWAQKRDVSLGLKLRRDIYRVPNANLYDKDVVNEFVGTVVPVGETRVFPFVETHAYRNDFLRIRDFETLGLQEDYRLGYDVVARAYPIFTALGSSRDLFGVRAGAMYTIAMGDGFTRLMIDSVTELEVERIADARLDGELRIVSPKTPGGRFVLDIAATNRWRNYLNRISEIGGEDRLRGWPTRYFVGKNLFASNLEFRTRPIEIFSIQLGAAAFYDTGSAWNGSFEEIHPAHSVGLGFRIVAPQLDRNVIRGDFGFPIVPGMRPGDVPPMSFFFSFHQAFRTSRQPGPFGP